MNAEYINPFIKASQLVLKNVCQIDTAMGRPMAKEMVFAGDIVLIDIGITGQLSGNVVISMDRPTAYKIASAMMMGMPVTELDDMSKSAISELGNMILGNAATFLSSSVIIDITPPMIITGESIKLAVSKSKAICVPLLFGENKIQLSIAVKEKE